MLHRTPINDAEIAGLFDGPAWIAAMARFEAALADAQAALGVIPDTAARAIAAALARPPLTPEAVATAAMTDGNPAIPFVRLVGQAVDDPQVAGWIHFGATSQDLIDSAMMLMTNQALAVLDQRLTTVGDRLAAHAIAERETVVVARTLGQHALPTSLGAKIAFWLDPLVRHRDRLARLRRTAVTLQFGGAVGTLAAFGPDTARALTIDLAQRLGLGVPAVPWHSTRDRVADVVHGLAQITAACAKTARDVQLLMQTEIAELAEGRAGGSSTMPHKRNPVLTLRILAAHQAIAPLTGQAITAAVGDQERSAGPWHGEWALIPEAAELCGVALAATDALLDALVINRDRMRRNLAMTQGLAFAEALTFALAPVLGRDRAKGLVGRLASQVRDDGTSLQMAAAADPTVTTHLSPAAIQAVFDPLASIGQARQIVDETVRLWQLRL